MPIAPDNNAYHYVVEENSELEAFILEEYWLNCSNDYKRKCIAFAFEGQVTERKLIFKNPNNIDHAVFAVTKHFPDQLGLTVSMHLDIEIRGLRAKVLELVN